MQSPGGAARGDRRSAATQAIAARLPAGVMLAFVLAACGAQPMSFRDALEANDRVALQTEVDRVLAAQDPGDSQQARMEALRRWIAGRDGVATARLNPDLLDTEPPVQQIEVTLEGEPDRILTIGVLLDPRGLRFNIR